MDVIKALEATIRQRLAAGDESASYVAALGSQGRERIAQKLGEEATETVIAALSEGNGQLTAEAADLIFHLLILLADAGLTFDDVCAELGRREGVSGHAEKAARGG